MHSVAAPPSSPAHLRKMPPALLQGLADDIRQMIVSACLRNGGHLGASLGTVELAIALHLVFESPSEPIVWDVGHQAYAHKLLTGRWERFGTLRQTGGISGFLSRDESEHDAFGAGHSSTALSAALGMARARAGTDRWTVAVVGDGGLTAGVAFEALNNVRAAECGPLLLVLNDNQMSISSNVGALPAILASGEAGKFFELFGFEYAGPVDGHDLEVLAGALRAIRRGYAGKPIVLHAHTQKGKGYVPAEESPSVYHGVSPVREKVAGGAKREVERTYSDAFGTALCALAERDPKVLAITAAMPEGTGLAEFARRFPERFFDVGIAEPHAVTFAAGLATQGYKPVVAIYSTFLQRGVDALIHDVALQRLGVTFAVDRAGLVGADGPTHHGMFDLAYLGMVPGLSVSAPGCQAELASELESALASGRPWAIRYPRGSGPAALPGEPFGDGAGASWIRRVDDPEVIAVALGSVAPRMQAAVEEADPRGSRVAAVRVFRAKPWPAGLERFLDAHPRARILVAEDGVIRGGFGQSLLAGLAPREGRVAAAGYSDEFVPHGTPEALEDRVGLSRSALAARLRSLLGA